LSLCAYSCADLFFQDLLLKNCIKGLIRIKERTSTSDISVVVGLPVQSGGKLFNCAAFVSSGEIKGIVTKSYLSNSNEFYEERWFSSESDRVRDHVVIDGSKVPFGADLLFEAENFQGLSIGIELCEDLWALIPPSLYMAGAGASVIINISASNEILGKKEYRRNLVRFQSAKCISAYLYSASGSGESTTDLVFSGHSMIAENGTMLEESERFKLESNTIIADIDVENLLHERIKNNSYGFSLPLVEYRRIPFTIAETVSDKLTRDYPMRPFVPDDVKKKAEILSEILNIQTTALAKRMKHIGAQNCVVGVSGGLDSTLALIVAYKTFEKLGLNTKGIKAVSMPGFGTSARTKSNAEALSNELELDFSVIPISDAVSNHFDDIGHNPENHDIVFENAQARERTQILMDIANSVGGIVIGTGDLSELALGWCTYSGDQMSMYGVNSGVPKTLVRHLVQWCASDLFDGKITNILLDICDTPISPELLPLDKAGSIAQKTEDNIGPYILHDFFLYFALRFNFSPRKILLIAELSFKGKFKKEEIRKWLEIFYRRLFSQQFKRSCMPDGVKVGTVSLSPRGDWRMPSDASSSLWLDEIEKI